jgi:deazaflavin-dependent oxidoreductase (nitroreductase family)
MVPLHRAGMAAWLGNPVTSWQCLLTTTGRRSGLPRPVPLGYIAKDGAVWVMAGYGPGTQWYRNILADPRIQLQLPGRSVQAAVAQEARDPSVRARIIPPLIRSMGVPGAMIGCIPQMSADERILACVSWVPLVRITAAEGQPIIAGPDDPGGHGWMWRQAVVFGSTAVMIAGVLAAARSRRL